MSPLPKFQSPFGVLSVSCEPYVCYNYSKGGIYMRSTSFIKAAKTGYIIMSLLYCVLGVLMIVNPSLSAVVIARICGAVLIGFGIIKIAGYFSKDLFRLAFQYDLAFGILIIMLGALICIKPYSAMNFMCIVLGVCALADGLLKIQITVDSKRFGIKRWWLLLILALITCAAGIMLIVWHAESTPVLMIILGASLLSEGILNLATVLTAVKIIKRDIDIIEYYEEN